MKAIKLLEPQIQFKALMSVAREDAEEIGCDFQTALREFTFGCFYYEIEDYPAMLKIVAKKQRTENK